MQNTSLDLLFPPVGRKEVVARFDGGSLTSDAGLLLVALADRRIGLTQRSFCRLEARYGCCVALLKIAFSARVVTYCHAE